MEGGADLIELGDPFHRDPEVLAAIAPERRLLSWVYDHQRPIRSMVKAIVDIDTIRIAGTDASDNLASSRPRRVNGKPGFSIQAFRPSRPSTRSANPRPLLYPAVMIE